MQAGEQPAAEELLGALRTISGGERRRHASVLNYWLSIRGDKEFPPLHDLDPLELSDAGPSSLLLELISGGHDAEVRYLGDTLKPYVGVDKIIDAPSPSLLACIAKKLPIVAISRDFLAFEDEFPGAEGANRCWVTLLPLSAGGAWVDYVYALVSLDGVPAKAAEPAKSPSKKAKAQDVVPESVEEVLDAVEASEVVPEPVEEVAEVVPGSIEEVVEAVPEPVEEVAEFVREPMEQVAELVPDEEVAEEVPVEDTAELVPDMIEEPQTTVDEPEPPTEAAETSDEQDSAEAPAPAALAPKAVPGFAKLFDSLAGLTGFYGSEPVKVEPVIPAAAATDEPSAGDAAAEEQSAEEPAPLELAAEMAAIEEPVTKRAEAPAPALEGSLQSKLTDVRAKADEARMAKLRANIALYEGLAAAYDFALDAEDAPEEYLRLVEAQGLKIQLRAPMKPVVKLAFEGMCDEATIKQLEAVLAWALKEELPRGSLAERLEAAGGVGGVLNLEAKAA
jgi:hypothetical protein